MIAGSFVAPFPTAAPIVVQAIGLRKQFGSIVALSGINLTACRGESVGLIGPNGSGRTTLLRVLATLVAPTAGTVEIGGFDAVRHVREVRRRVVFIGSEFPPTHGLTVRQFLAWVQQTRGAAASADPRILEDAIARAELRDEAPVDLLSRGCRHRLAITAALLVAPEVLLVDDALQALDERGRSRFIKWIREVRERGMTVIAAVNDDASARLLCDRNVRLAEGRLL